MEYTLNLTAERSVVRESTKGVIWSIFFQRLFGPITPGTNEFFDIPYPIATDLSDLDALIDEKVDLSIKKYFQQDQTHEDIKHGKIIIQFSDRMAPKKKTSWFGQGKEETEGSKLWESWVIHIQCIPISATDTSNKSINNDENILRSIESFETNLNRIIYITDTHKDHIPPITSLESSPFPYTISIENNSNYNVGEDTWGSYIKKIMD